jgi:hypothetical protein
MRPVLWVATWLTLASATSVLAQESKLQAEFRREGERLKEDCAALTTLLSCAATLVTGHPLHVALGSIAPQNGLGFGPALSMHFTPNERWRNSWSTDAIVAAGGAWRASTSFKAIQTNVQLPSVVAAGTAPSPALIRITEYPIVSGYVQAISLPTLTYYGIGDDTAEASKTTYGMKEVIVGGEVHVPVRNVARVLNMSLLGDLHGRLFDIRRGEEPDVPQIGERFDESSAPGLNTQPAFMQFGEGVRVRPMLFNDRLQLGYTFQLQQFISPQSGYSFNRWTVHLSHEVPIYRTGAPATRRETNNPNECSISPSNRDCPKVTRDRWGAAGFRFLASKSQVGDESVVPFYLQRTLGGSDINGSRALPSYADYRFRGPHLLLFQETFEHSVWGPIGLFLQADQGRVAAQNEALDVQGLKYSTTIGATLRAGGFPALTAAWGTGGREGNHVIITLDTSLLGGGSRPSLQ